MGTALTSGEKGTVKLSLAGAEQGTVKLSLSSSGVAFAPALQPPDTPTGLAVDSVTTTSATLSWNAVAGATSYDLRYSLAGQNDWTEVIGVTSPSEVTGLTSGTAYDFQVRAVNSAGASDWSTSVEGTTEAAYEAETLAFQTRVLADGGTVGDLDFVDAIIAYLKSQGRLSDLLVAVGPEMGYKATSGAIGTLYDLRGNNDLAQATTAAKPTLTTSGLFGGKTVATFDGDDDFINTAALTRAHPFVIFALGRMSETNPPATQHDLVGFGSGSFIRGHANGDWRYRNGGTTLTSTSDSDLDVHLHTLAANGASTVAYLDGALEVTGNMGTSGISEFTLGRENSVSSFFPGDIACALVVAGTLTSTQREAVEGIIANHYGHTL